MIDRSSYAKCAACGLWVPPEQPTVEDIADFTDPDQPRWAAGGASAACVPCAEHWIRMAGFLVTMAARSRGPVQ